MRPSTSKASSLARATSANCRNRSSSPTCCTAWINVMLSVVIGLAPSVKGDVSQLHLTGVGPMAQPLGHPKITPFQWTLPRRLSERVLTAVMQEAWVGGMSTRKVDDLVQALGMTGISKAQVSERCGALDERVNDFLDR